MSLKPIDWIKGLFGPSVIAGQVRHLLTALTGALLGYGATQPQLDTFVNAVVALIPAIIAMVGSAVSKK